MIRSVLSVAAGYVSIAALDIFVRAITAFYTNTEIVLTGFADLPSPGWQYSVLGMLLIFGIVGGLLTSALSVESGKLEVLVLILLLVIAGFIDHRALAESEPLWYLIATPILKIAGVFLGYRIKILIDLANKH